jgi:serine/threonine protein kinase/tetratricopeptide (TPR) repeat protein
MSLTPGTKLGTFEITGSLGKGGMGEVYLAKDAKLGREVAIKVLPESFASDEERLARFEREARTLAALDHPNVAGVYDFREEDNVHFLVMQLVAGETLDDRIARGALSIMEALPLFVGIARGLDAAHEAGIIHRDLKPANVNVTEDGDAKVLDFGLAAGVGADSTLGELPDSPNASPTDTTLPGSPPSPKITTDGTVLGTPSYMSPEQARGKSVDKRTDIWAFGCCLYETLTAQSPFRGETTSETIAAIIEHDPDWEKLPKDTPVAIRFLLRRCLEKESRRRLSSAGDIAVMLEDVQEAQRREIQSPESKNVSATQSQGMPSWAMALGILMVALIGIGGMLIRLTGPPNNDETIVSEAENRIQSLAVMPFEKLSNDETEDYFVNGMTETLTAELAKIDSLTIKARASAMRYKGTEKSPREIAQELGVDGLLKGFIQRTENDVVITAQLIDGKTNVQIWADNFEGTVENILQLQGRVAIAIATQLDAVLAPEERAGYEQARDVNPAAWEFYLKAREAFRLRTVDGFARAIDLLKGAIAADPEFSEAYALLGWVHSTRPLNFAMFSTSDDVALAQGYAARALELDPGLIEARFALAYVARPGKWDWKGCEQHIQAALNIDPSRAYVRFLHGVQLFETGRLREGEAAMRRAIELDPWYPVYHWNLGYELESQGRYEDALIAHRRALEISPNMIGPSQAIPMNLALQGKSEESLAALDHAHPDGEDTQPIRVAVYAVLGMEEEASAGLAQIAKHREIKETSYTIWALAILGREEEALDQVERLFDQHVTDGLMGMLRMGPANPLWDNDRTWEIYARFNVPHFPSNHPAFEHQEAWLRKKAAREVLAAQPKPVRKLEIPLPNTQFARNFKPSISPDGKTISYSEGGRLWIRPLDSLTPRPILGSEGARGHFWSTDSKWIFFGADFKLWKIRADGGNPIPLANHNQKNLSFTAGGSWTKDGNILFTTGFSPLLSVPSGGGPMTTVMDMLDGEADFHGGSLIPNDGGILFVVHLGGNTWPVVRYNDGKREGMYRLEGAALDSPQYLPTGHLIFASNWIGSTYQGIWAVPFSLDEMEARGDPVLIVTDGHSPSVADDGTLIYLNGEGSDVTQLAWVNVDDRSIDYIGKPQRGLEGVRLSANGDKAVFMGEDGSAGDLWVQDLATDSEQRITFDDPKEERPVLSANGSIVFYQRRTPDGSWIYKMDTSTKESAPLVRGERPDLSEDGAYLAYASVADSDDDGDIWVKPLKGEAAPILVVNKTGRQILPVISPNGKYLAYMSDETGNVEIFVTEFPESKTHQRVSDRGGLRPRWSNDGKSIYYVQVVNTLMKAPLTFDPTIRAATPEVVLEGDDVQSFLLQGYDISDDEESVILIKSPEHNEAKTSIVVVENFLEELKQIAPVKVN